MKKFVLSFTFKLVGLFTSSYQVLSKRRNMTTIYWHHLCRMFIESYRKMNLVHMLLLVTGV